MLHKAPLPVHAVPIVDRVERIKESLKINQLRKPVSLQAIIGGVEKAHAKAVQRGGWHVERQVQRDPVGQRERLRRPVRGLRRGCVIRPHQHRPAQRISTGEAVNPGYRVPVSFIRFVHDAQRVAQASNSLVIHDHVGGLHSFELDAGGEDDPGKAHASDRGPKDFASVCRRAGKDFASRSQQSKIPNEVRDRPLPMMVLAVNISGNGPADRNPFRARRYRQEETARQEAPHDLGKTDPCFALQKPGLAVERQETVQAHRADGACVRVERGISIAAAEAPGNVGRFRAGMQYGPQIRLLLGPVEVARLDWEPAPARQLAIYASDAKHDGVRLVLRFGQLLSGTPSTWRGLVAPHWDMMASRPESWRPHSGSRAGLAPYRRRLGGRIQRKRFAGDLSTWNAKLTCTSTTLGRSWQKWQRHSL